MEIFGIFFLCFVEVFVYGIWLVLLIICNQSRCWATLAGWWISRYCLSSLFCCNSCYVRGVCKIYGGNSYWILFEVGFLHFSLGRPCSRGCLSSTSCFWRGVMISCMVLHFSVVWLAYFTIFLCWDWFSMITCTLLGLIQCIGSDLWGAKNKESKLHIIWMLQRNLYLLRKAFCHAPTWAAYRGATCDKRPDIHN